MEKGASDRHRGGPGTEKRNDLSACRDHEARQERRHHQGQNCTGSEGFAGAYRISRAVTVGRDRGNTGAEMRDIMTEDELELDTMGDRKTALFLIMSDTDTTFNFVIAMLQSQLFNLLCDKADDFYNGRLPVHVRCLLDEFANIGQIPNFDKLIATIRSREISASIILQSQSQLKTIYKDAADTIVGNCDSTLFLGGKEKGTLKEISELLGKETIDSLSQSENRGAQTSHGLSYQKLGKELMTQDEIAVMDGGKCILQLRGVRPFFSDKFDITKHPRYQYLSDADKKNVFDVERYMKRRPAIVKPDEPFDMYELSAKDLTDEPDNNSTKRKEI